MLQYADQDHQTYGAVRRVHSFFPYNVTDARRPGDADGGEARVFECLGLAKPSRLCRGTVL